MLSLSEAHAGLCIAVLALKVSLSWTSPMSPGHCTGTDVQLASVGLALCPLDNVHVQLSSPGLAICPLDTVQVYLDVQPLLD